MYQPVSSLNLPDFKVQELHAAGYHYCKDVDTSADNFKSKVDIPEWDQLRSVPKTKNALDIYQEECVHGTVATSNRQLDEVLGGGIPVGSITEFCGEPGSGKTQLCYFLCINVQLPTWCGGMAGEAIFISTNKGFASHRLKEIAVACVDNYRSFKAKQPIVISSDNSDRDFNAETILQKIYCINIDNHVELLALVKYLEKYLTEHSLIRLVVIDTISAPLKAISFQEKTQVLHSILKELQELAQQYRFAIVLTNNITTRIQAANSAYHTPSLGGSYYHRINIRVELAKISANKFRASVVKNVLRPSMVVEFTLFS